MRELSDPIFCRQCGTALKPNSQFCPKCGKIVTTVLPPTQPQYQAPPQSQATSPQQSNKLWGIDKRIFVIAIIALVLILPVIPRDKVVYVDGQTVTTQTVQAITTVTSFQPYVATVPSSVQVYAGTIQYVSQPYYYSYQNYYRNCYIIYGHVQCSWGGGYPWPSYGSYVNSVTVDPSQNVVRVDRTQQSAGLWTMTLWRYDGTSWSVNNVYSDNLAQTASSTVQTTVTQTSTILNQVTNPQVTISSVPCQSCIPQHVTERVSILQILLGM